MVGQAQVCPAIVDGVHRHTLSHCPFRLRAAPELIAGEEVRSARRPTSADSSRVGREADLSPNNRPSTQSGSLRDHNPRRTK